MSKFKHSLTKKLQLLGDFVPQIPYWGFAPGPHWGTSVPQTSCPPFPHSKYATGAHHSIGPPLNQFAGSVPESGSWAISHTVRLCLWHTRMGFIHTEKLGTAPFYDWGCSEYLSSSRLLKLKKARALFLSSSTR